MRIAVLSDTRLPTSKNYPGHGLGKQVLKVAEGMAERGHIVTLYAGPGSEFTSGALEIQEDERLFSPREFDVILDSTHAHGLQQKLPDDAPIINWSHDRESRPGRNAIFPSKAHRDYHRYNGDNSQVIYNGVEVPELTALPPGKYFAFLSTFQTPKAPVMAYNAARLAGVSLAMAGNTPPLPIPGANYLGLFQNAERDEFFQRARALLFPAGTEAGPVTPLEAQAVGCPVIVIDHGAAQENINPGVTGFVVKDTLEMVKAIHRIDEIKREDCRTWVKENRGITQMLNDFEAALRVVANGGGW